MSVLHPATIPTARTEDWWQLRHQQKIAERQAMNNKVDLLFLGDSITHAWETEGEQAWQQYFASENALNLGYAGDRTEHMLWRIQQGEINELSPKWVVLLAGTNNAGHRHDSPEDISAGIGLILKEIKRRLPASKIVLMAIFPRSRDPKKRMRIKIDQANSILQGLTDKKTIFWLNINQQFLTNEGVLLESVMPDLLHPNAAQYKTWAKSLSALFTANW